MRRQAEVIDGIDARVIRAQRAGGRVLKNDILQRALLVSLEPAGPVRLLVGVLDQEIETGHGIRFPFQPARLHVEGMDGAVAAIEQLAAGGNRKKTGQQRFRPPRLLA